MRGMVLAVLLAAGWHPAAQAAVPAAAGTEVDPELRRELRIGADVLRAALAESLPEGHRVTDVEAGLLAQQGVLVIVEVAEPWLNRRGPEIHIGREIVRLEHIPAMVQDILDELNVGLSREQAEDLEELRAVREAQRAVRAEQRRLRAELREKRRMLIGADDDAALRREVEDLQAALAAAEAEERALAADADLARDALESSVAASRPGDGDEGTMDGAVAEAVCGYGATFKSLDRHGYLNVVVRQERGSRYYVFPVGPVRRCQEGRVDAQGLLEQSVVYEG